MSFWEVLWTVVWFGGLAAFSYLAVIVTIRGGKDLLALLRDLRSESMGEKSPHE